MLEQLGTYATPGNVPNAAFWSTHYVHAKRTQLLTLLKTDHIAALLRRHVRGIFLEAGCGTAHYSYDLFTKGITAYGVDYSDEAIHAAQREFPEIAKCIQKADLFFLPYPAAFFDSYFSPGVIEHYTQPQDRQRILREAYRVLKPGGTLIVTVPHATPIRLFLWPINLLLNRFREKKGASFYQYRYRGRELRSEITRAGFLVQKTDYLNPDFFSVFVQKLLGTSFLRNLFIIRYLFGHSLAVVAIKPEMISSEKS